MSPVVPPPRAASISGPTSSLPDYEHPPVVEVVLCVHWESPLAEVGEIARNLQPALGAEWTVAPEAEHGVWTLNNLLQDGRIRLGRQALSVSWLGYEGGRYPHYESLRDSFVAAWVALQGRRSELKAAAWSVGYINRIPQGTVWQTPADWTFCRLIPPLQNPTSATGVSQLSLRWTWPLRDDRGELTADVSLGPAVGGQPDCLWLSLRSAGPATDCETGLLDGLDFGRQTIVRTFRELMTPEANAYWGLLGRPTP